MKDKLFETISWVEKRGTDIKNGEGKKLRSYGYNASSGTNVKRKFSFNLKFEDGSVYIFNEDDIVDFIDSGETSCIIFKDENDNDRRLILCNKTDSPKIEVKENTIEKDEDITCGCGETLILIDENEECKSYFKRPLLSGFSAIKVVKMGDETFQKEYDNIIFNESSIYLLDYTFSGTPTVIKNAQMRVWCPSWMDDASDILIIKRGNECVIIFPSLSYNVELIKKLASTIDQIETISMKYDKRKSPLGEMLDKFVEEKKNENDVVQINEPTEIVKSAEEEKVDNESNISDENVDEEEEKTIDFNSPYRILAEMMIEEGIDEVHFWTDPNGKVHCDIKIATVYGG